MKKIFYSLMTVAALLTAASCQKEFTNSPDPAYGGKPVVTTFSVDLGVTTKASASTGLDDGTTVNKLYVAAFGSDGKLVSTSLVGNNAKSATGPSTQVSLTLSKGQAYDIVFFWVYDGAYNVSFADNNTATFSYKTSSLKANDPQLDAFYTKVSVASASTTTESVTLKRPFAQINVLSSNVPEGQTAFKSTMTVKAAPTTFDLFNGAVGSETADLEFAENAISEAAFGKYAQNYTWIGMNFVLPAASGAVAVNFKESGMAAAIDVNNVAVKKNTRTNLVGAIYDLDATITYNVTVDPIFENEGEAGLDDEDTEITVADGSSYTANNPLVIDASNGANPVSVTLNVNGGDNFSDIESGAAGGVIEASSDNEDVATAEVNKTGNAVTITPVGNGTANITVTTPRYTKAFSAGSITIPVHVTGFSAEAEDPTLTVTGAPTAATAEPFTLTVDTNSDGEITVTVDPKDAATVAVGTTAGTFVVTPASLEEDTEATLTVTVAATEAYNEASEEIAFTVAGEGGGSGDSGTKDNPYTVAEAIAAVADLTWTSNTEYDKTDEVYVTGIICSIANNGTYGQSGTFGNASYYISDDGSDTGDKFYVYRSLYFEKEKYTSGQDIKVGDTVVICGELMNYKGNTPETVANESYLYSLTAGADIESSISVADMSVEVGKTKTIQATVTPSNAVVTYTTTSSAITIDGNKVTGVSEGSATVTATIAAVEGSYKGSSTTFTVTVTAATGGDEDTATLTNDEIVAALSAGTETGNTYGDYSITSASGTWAGNMNKKNDLTYVQIRNNRGAHLMSPTFTKNIEKIELTINGGSGNNVQQRKFFAIAADTDLSKFGSTKDDNYNANKNDATWAAVTKYGNAQSTATSTNVEQTVTITLDSTVDTKNFMLVSYDGAAYITSITVYFK